jgi:hypothetical protein
MKLNHYPVTLLADKEDWAAILEPVLCQDAAAVECLARMLCRIKRAIDSGGGNYFKYLIHRKWLDNISIESKSWC